MDNNNNNLNLPRVLSNIKSPTKSPIKNMYDKQPLKIIIPDFDYNDINNDKPPLAPRQHKSYNFSFVEESN
tara:strand:+ start:340 stop:552 length:213 start_codon:yes stop_codon:yes gene_type:complete